MYILGTFLFFSLALLAYFLVFTQVTANPDKVKKILADSGVYQKVPSVIFDDSVDSGSTSSASIPLKDTGVRDVALETFTPGFVQKNVENLLDGTYDWLRGSTASPDFSLDLKEAKQQFAVNLGKLAAARLKRLPVCPDPQPKEVDPLTTPCRPAGADIKALQKQVRVTAANSDNFLKETKIDASTLKNGDGQPLFDKSSKLPEAYQKALRLPYLTGLVCLLLGGAIILISRTRHDGLKRLGKLLLISGVFVILAPFAINHLITSALQASPDDNVAAKLLVPVIQELNRVTSKVYFVVGAVYILLAAAAFLAVRKLPEQTAKPAKKRTKS